MTFHCACRFSCFTKQIYLQFYITRLLDKRCWTESDEKISILYLQTF